MAVERAVRAVHLDSLVSRETATLLAKILPVILDQSGPAPDTRCSSFPTPRVSAWSLPYRGYVSRGTGKTGKLEVSRETGQ